ncbi:hypothetical protein EYF80_052478 [Liparis tanakae]|uniref:Uncharacterized protein n=1 Tax=Liparis tanakae TaxID=230148 RepID=A0A4Z2F912_9TELE|nr:hypothetical protein EYF80_052478 [Liparis tanakae]
MGIGYGAAGRQCGANRMLSSPSSPLSSPLLSPFLSRLSIPPQCPGDQKRSSTKRSARRRRGVSVIDCSIVARVPEPSGGGTDGGYAISATRLAAGGGASAPRQDDFPSGALSPRASGTCPPTASSRYTQTGAAVGLLTRLNQQEGGGAAEGFIVFIPACSVEYESASSLKDGGAGGFSWRRLSEVRSLSWR